jgi:hypothetical protein
VRQFILHVPVLTVLPKKPLVRGRPLVRGEARARRVDVYVVALCRERRIVWAASAKRPSQLTPSASDCRLWPEADTHGRQKPGLLELSHRIVVRL